MPKKVSEKPKQKEESKPVYDFATLVFAPSKYITALKHLALRLEKSIDNASTEAEKAFNSKTVEYLWQFASKLNNDYAPKPAKKITDAYDYALSRSYEGNFIALLDEQDNLVKTVILAKKRLQALPEFTLSEKTIQMTVNARFISVPELDIERSIPKRAVKAVPFSSDKKQVYRYGA